MPWLSAIFPRLCLGIFIVSQPLLLKSVVTYIESGKYSVAAQDGLIIAAVFVYGGLAVSSRPPFSYPLMYAHVSNIMHV